MPLEKQSYSKKNTLPFYIQPGHAKVFKGSLDPMDEWRDLFPKLFIENDESMYIFWHSIPIRFQYTFEFFANMDRISSLIKNMIEHPNGSEKIVVLTETLVSDWVLTWNNDDLRIKSNWVGKKNYEDYASALNKKGDIHCSKQEFLAEWKLPLVQIVNAFEAAKAIHLNDSIHTKLDEIGLVLSSLKNSSKRYEKMK